MDASAITQEQLTEVLKWVSGAPAQMAPKDIKSVIDTLAVAFRKRYHAEFPMSITPRLRTTAVNVPCLAAIAGPDVADIVNGRPEAKPSDMPSEPEPLEKASSMDSVLLINSISHVAMDAGRSISSSRAQLILYCVYGSHLAMTGVRLDIEHPQAWKYGPVFPRAFKKGSLADTGLCSDAFRRLSESEPQLAELVSWKTGSLLYTPMADLDVCHKGKTSPYGRTVGSNPDKWGVQIDDALIRDYFSRAQ